MDKGKKCNFIESALKSSLNFIETETEEVVSEVESGVEAAIFPFERFIQFIRHECELVEELKLIIGDVCELVSNLGNFIHGEPDLSGFITLLFWIGYCYICEIWMIPLLIPCIFLRQFILIYFKCYSSDIKEDKDVKKVEDKSISEMLQELCDVCDEIDTGIEVTALVIEKTKRTLNFKEPGICGFVILISFVVAVILHHIHLRYFIILGSIYIFFRNFYLKFNGKSENYKEV